MARAVPPPEASHIVAGAAWKATPPSLPVATSAPVPVSRTLTPAVFIPNLISASRGSRAASAVLTTSTCVKPRGVARTVRSTSGSTSR